MPQDEGKTQVGTALGMVVTVALVLFLLACTTCAILCLLGPQIGNIFSRISSGLEAAG